MTSVNVEKLYELCDTIDKDKTENKSEVKSEYLLVLSGTKGDEKCKRLSAQLIFRYFKSFPDLTDNSLDALFTLCEDPNVDIRKSVVKCLATLCKQEGPHVAKIGDVLVQLLQTDDTHEHQLVTNAILELLNNPKYTKDIFNNLFVHISHAEEELVRERAMRFVASKLPGLSPQVLTRPIEDLIMEQAKKVMTDVTGEEFIIFMHILSNLPHMQTVKGRQQLLDMVLEQADLHKPFDASDADRVDQVLQCARHAVPYLSKNVPSNRLLLYELNQVLPVLDTVAAMDNDVDTVKLEFLRNMAELTPTADIKTEDEPDKLMQNVVNALMPLLPSPPSVVAAASTATDADNKDENGVSAEVVPDEPNMMFSHVECLVYMLHCLGRKHESYLGEPFKKKKGEEGLDEHTVAMHAFQRNLTYLARRAQEYAGKLQTIIKKIPKEELSEEKHQVSVCALRMTSNLTVLLRDMLHVPPVYREHAISLSWRPKKTPEEIAQARKRSSISFETDNGAKAARREEGANQRQMYAPPSGKYSDKAGTYKEVTYDNGAAGVSSGSTFRGRGGGRGVRARGGRRGGRGGRWY